MRWQLSLVSILVALLATTLLAIAVIVAINYYYGADQRQRLMDIAGGTAQRVGESYAQRGSLLKAVNNKLPNTATQKAQNPDYLTIDLSTNRSPRLIYP